ncbi:hypothetical protein EVAR_57616_1 [Eumeta japonica]|uniref:Uncharacterized protein n=1 Tax=Eumeta variegata TaxID=151549 RepID=A0A4C1XYI6_EUMVA|nr:hypothetical protein EVAR_57616_1 [Eumeta japonica]
MGPQRDTFCPLELRGHFDSSHRFFGVRKPFSCHPFVNLFHEPHSTNIIFGHRRRKTFLTQIFSRISATSATQLLPRPPQYVENISLHCISEGSPRRVLISKLDHSVQFRGFREENQNEKQDRDQNSKMLACTCSDMQHAPHRRPSKPRPFHYEPSSNELYIDSRGLRGVEHPSERSIYLDRLFSLN